MPPFIPMEFRLLEGIELDRNGCWLWTKALDQHGYGTINVGRNKRGAHRVAYQVFVGPIPPGLETDHLCRVRRCINPQHLEPVTGATNIRRGKGLGVINAAKTHCPQGHEYTEENTIISRMRRPSGGIRYARRCKECQRRANRRSRDEEVAK